MPVRVALYIFGPSCMRRSHLRISISRTSFIISTTSYRANMSGQTLGQANHDPVTPSSQDDEMTELFESMPDALKHKLNDYDGFAGMLLFCFIGMHILTGLLFILFIMIFFLAIGGYLSFSNWDTEGYLNPVIYAILVIPVGLTAYVSMLLSASFAFLSCTRSGILSKCLRKWPSCKMLAFVAMAVGLFIGSNCLVTRVLNLRLWMTWHEPQCYRGCTSRGSS